MNRLTRYISAGIFTGLIFLLLLAAYSSQAVKRGRMACTGVEVTVLDSMKNSFVDSRDILSYLRSEYGDFTGKNVDSISLIRIEKDVDARSAVRKSEAYITKDGILHVDITQREPAVRFQKGAAGFYADAEGCLFPLQDTYTAHVPIVDGDLPLRADTGYKGKPQSEEEREWIMAILRLLEYMDDSGTWARDIVQINVLEGGDLLMVPREGREKFIFGPPDGAEEKFRKMELYYTGIVPEKGEGYYSSVNLKYDRQIICRK